MPLTQVTPSHAPKGAALITGAAKRIGRTIALRLAERGYALALHCRASRKEADELASEIKGHGGQAVVVVADLADPRAVERVIPEAQASLGPLDVLINNASLFERDDIRTATLDSWNAHIDTNLRAPFFLSQAFATQLPKDRNGAIINILDMRVWRLTPHFASYTVSKAGLWTLTQTLAMALAPRIRVNGIGPGPILPSTHQTEGQFAAQCAATPLNRGSSPEEIAATVAFLLDAPAITGQMIALDGGEHLPWRSNQPGADQ